MQPAEQGREASIGCRPTTARKHAAPDSSAPQNPVMDKWLGYPSRPIQQGDKNMTNTTAANGKEAAYFGVPCGR